MNQVTWIFVYVTYPYELFRSNVFHIFWKIILTSVVSCAATFSTACVYTCCAFCAPYAFQNRLMIFFKNNSFNFL